MERDVEFLLGKYYNKYGQEKFAIGERWSNEHMNEHISEGRIQEKMILSQQLGFRLSADEKYMIKCLIRKLDNDFNRIDFRLSNEQILTMMICFIRMEKDRKHDGFYYKKMEEHGISKNKYVRFLISLLKVYRA